MDQIHYADEIILTGTDIARALLDYAEALAKRATSATVEIPCRESDGSLGHARFLIGPASQIVSHAVPSDTDEVVDVALVAALKAETQRLTGAQVRLADQPPLDEVTKHGFEYRDPDDR